MIQLGISCSKIINSPPSNRTGTQHNQVAVLFMLLMGIVESIPSVIQFVKAFPYEIREDDAFLLFHYSLVVLSFLASNFAPHPRHITWFVTFSLFFCYSEIFFRIFSFLVSVAILCYGLVPFYRVAWFITVLSVVCIISYFPLERIGLETKLNKSKTD